MRREGPLWLICGPATNVSREKWWPARREPVTRLVTKPAKGTRVIVLDDDPLFCEFVEEVLSEEGYEVEAAGHGAELFRLLAERRPNLLILDFLMPDFSGRQILESIRVTYPQLPILGVSAQLMPKSDNMFGAIAPGLQIPKPLSRSRLVQAVRALLDAV